MSSFPGARRSFKLDFAAKTAARSAHIGPRTTCYDVWYRSVARRVWKVQF
jgi:hypothetical protein